MAGSRKSEIQEEPQKGDFKVVSFYIFEITFKGLFFISIYISPRQKNFKHELQLRLTDHVIHDHNGFNKKIFGLLGLHN